MATEIMETETITEEMKKLYESNTGDVTILLWDRSVLKVLSLILIRQSKVLEKDLLALRDKEVFDMTFFSPDVVRQFFAYIYYRDLFDFEKNKNIKDWFDLLNLTSLYELKRYTKYITEQICKRINDESIYEIIKYTVETENIDGEIQKVALQYLKKMIVNRIKTEPYSGNCYDKIASIPHRYCCKCDHKKGWDANPGVWQHYPHYCYYYTSRNEQIPPNACFDYCCKHKGGKKDIAVCWDKIKEFPANIRDELLRGLVE